MEIVTNLAMILAVVGALNWGLVGIFKFDLVAFVTCLLYTSPSTRDRG